MKRRISKRLLVGLLALTLMLTLMPLSAFAEDPDPDSTPITSVTVTNVPTPVPGESCSGEGIVITTEPAVKLTASIHWYDETNDLQRDPDDTFHDGWEYSLIIDLKAAPGYYFERVDVDEDAEEEPDYTYAGVARMDGSVPARVVTDGDEYLTIIGKTTTAGDAPTEPTPITSVKITNVPTPVAGGSCDTDAVVITTDPADKFDSASLDISWYDETAKKYCDPTDKFIAGHEYTFNVYVKATTGYRFDSTGAGDVYTGTATINGEDAYSAFTMASDKTDLVIHGATIKVEEPTPITSVKVTNVPTPVAGGSCDTDAVVITTDPADKFDSASLDISWYDETAGKFCDPTDAFIAGHEYTFNVYVKAVTGYRFDSTGAGDVYTGTATINGEDAYSAFTMATDKTDLVIHGAPIKVEEPATPTDPTYVFTSGDGSKYTLGSGKTLKFTTDGPMADCTDVSVDGYSLEAGDYTLESGSTIITLNNAYLETLAEGEHNIRAHYGRTHAEANFTVLAAEPETPVDPADPDDKPADTVIKPTQPTQAQTGKPNTGDNSQAGLWLALMAGACSGLAVIYRRKKSSAK